MLLEVVYRRISRLSVSGQTVTPRYDPVGRLIEDAPLETALALIFIALFVYKNYV